MKAEIRRNTAGTIVAIPSPKNLHNSCVFNNFQKASSESERLISRGGKNWRLQVTKHRPQGPGPFQLT